MRHLLSVFCCLPALLFCSCGKKEITKDDEDRLAEIVKQADRDMSKDKFSCILEYTDQILTIVKPLKNCDEVYCAESFAYDAIGCYYFAYGDHFTANSYYMQAMKYADLISAGSVFQVLGKADIYFHFYILYSRRKNLAEYWMKEWHNFLRSYLKSPEQLKKNKKLNEVFWTQYAVYTGVKMKSLVKNNKMDDALRLLSEFDLNISKFDLNPDEIPGYFSLNNTAAVIYSLKNDPKEMVHHAEKAVKFAERRLIFPEKSFFLLIRYYMEQGKYQIAERYCFRGLVLCDLNQIKSDLRWKIDLWILLADIQWKCKNKDMARVSLSEAEKLNPPPDLMNMIRKKQKEWF